MLSPKTFTNYITEYKETWSSKLDKNENKEVGKTQKHSSDNSSNIRMNTKNAFLTRVCNGKIFRFERVKEKVESEK